MIWRSDAAKASLYTQSIILQFLSDVIADEKKLKLSETMYEC
jgi:hypothetical protein